MEEYFWQLISIRESVDYEQAAEMRDDHFSANAELFN
jgi:hypothetical protein